jgi:agmatine deiminase
VAWPSHGELWEEALAPVQDAFVALCRAIGEGERLDVLVPDEARLREARARLSGLPARLHVIPFGDIWLRDTAPLFLMREGGVRPTCFRFNGWGRKYELPGDDEVARRIAAALGAEPFTFPFVLEGGSVETDGEGTCLTTRQCLLHPNRNRGWSERSVEEALALSLGVTKVLWLGDGLLNDHTDGHVDTLARFVAPGRVVCMEARDADDPNRAVLSLVASDLASFSDASGRGLEVIRVPSPGLVEDGEGRQMPASYVNFYVGNSALAVPQYGVAADEEALSALAALFPSRRAVGIPARDLLSGGGAFHCITQQQPEGEIG